MKLGEIAQGFGSPADLYSASGIGSSSSAPQEAIHTFAAVERGERRVDTGDPPFLNRNELFDRLGGLSAIQPEGLDPVGLFFRLRIAGSGPVSRFLPRQMEFMTY